jgi:hypothetical protein
VPLLFLPLILPLISEISGRNSSGTKHSGGPPDDGSEKRPKYVGVLDLQTRFNVLLVLNVKVGVF